MAEAQNGESAGLLSALRGAAATLLATCKTRLDLLSNEIEVEKLRAIRLLLLAQAMAFCFAVGIVLAVALLAVLFWEQRLAVLPLGALLFLVLGVVLLARLKAEAKRRDRIFSASVAELEEDVRQLRALHEHERSS